VARREARARRRRRFCQSLRRRRAKRRLNPNLNRRRKLYELFYV
jgi:hypothetical protein